MKKKIHTNVDESWMFQLSNGVYFYYLSIIPTQFKNAMFQNQNRPKLPHTTEFSPWAMIPYRIDVTSLNPVQIF